MIVTALLKLIYYITFALTLPFRILPDVSLSEDFLSAVTTANGYLWSFNGIVPIGTLISVFAAIITVELVVLSYKLIMWVLTKIPGISN